MDNLSSRGTPLRPHFFFRRLPLSLAVLTALSGAADPVLAQDRGAPAADRPRALPAVTVTANPLGDADTIAPVQRLDGDALLLRERSTLGETLQTLPGVSNTWFGPNAGRPIIRGLDGDRIRILDNSGASVDASGLSYDHAVPTNPLSVERIEVLRGPGALLYGGNAVGGVVNLIDNRIAREPSFDASGGVIGSLDLGYSSGSREKNGAAWLETGTDRFALHVDGFKRGSGDLGVPVALRCARPGAPALARRICNSAADSHGGALGGTVFFGRGYAGLSASSYRSDYGTVAEDEVTIAMRSNRYAFETGLRDLSGPLRSLRLRAGHTDYTHTEYEAGAVGTVFRNAGNDLRLEARHAPLGAFEGVIGLQLENTRFSADGDEAFAPHSRTRQGALFLFEELPLSWGRFSIGARSEQVRLQSDGNPQVARFTPARRDFDPLSMAAGLRWDVSSNWQFSSNLARSQRAPKDYELFADGPHIATNSYEVGNPAFGVERSTNLDLGVEWKSGHHSMRIGGFVNRFRNYIALQSTGRLRDTEGNGAGGVGVTDDGTGNSVESGGAAKVLSEYTYEQVSARFQGLEASGKLRLLDGPHTVDLDLRGDLVRATNTRTGKPLPRIAPVRLGATVAWTHGPWGLRLGVDHAMAQRRVPVGERSSDGYTMWNLALSWRQRVGAAQLLWYARLDNLGDTLAYSASSILTQTAQGKAPLPGRSVKVGVRATF